MIISRDAINRVRGAVSFFPFMNRPLRHPKNTHFAERLPSATRTRFNTSLLIINMLRILPTAGDGGAGGLADGYGRGIAAGSPRADGHARGQAAVARTGALTRARYERAPGHRPRDRRAAHARCLRARWPRCRTDYAARTVAHNRRIARVVARIIVRIVARIVAGVVADGEVHAPGRTIIVGRAIVERRGVAVLRADAHAQVRAGSQCERGCDSRRE